MNVDVWVKQLDDVLCYVVTFQFYVALCAAPRV